MALLRLSTWMSNDKCDEHLRLLVRDFDTKPPGSIAFNMQKPTIASWVADAPLFAYGDVL